MSQLIAYHGKPALKVAFLEQIAFHERMGEIGHKGYASVEGNKRMFCACGCSLESLRVMEGLDQIEHSDHALYERYLGVPIMLARLEDRIFEGLPAQESLRWPRRFSEAIQPGADLSMVGQRFLHELISDPDGAVQRQAVRYPKIKPSIDAVAALFARWFETGTKPSVTEWREARAAAYAAAAAAVAAAAAAAAADAAAADAAAYAAYAVAAADAAAADAARASRSQEFSRQANALERLLRDAPLAAK